MAFWNHLSLLLLVCMVSRAAAQGDTAIVASGFGNPDDDDDWTMIDDEDYVQNVTESVFSVTAVPSKDCSAWIAMLENREAVMFALREGIEQMATSYCGCKTSISADNLECTGNELLYSGNITQTLTSADYSKEDVVELIQQWALDEPKLNATLLSGDTLFLQVVKLAGPTVKSGSEGRLENSSAEATLLTLRPRWLLVSSILMHFIVSLTLML